MALILELQRDAMDGEAPVSQIVRRAYVAARKLDLTSLGKWLELEHKGYLGEEPLPDYRIVRIHSYRIWYFYHGWQPIEFAANMRELFASRPVGGSVAWVEEALKNPNLYVKVPDEMIDHLPQENPSAINYYSLQGKVGHESFTNILEMVRSIILDWTLDLESQGVLGDDLSFSDKDKEIAKEVSGGFTIGNITGSQVLINSPHSTQEMQRDVGAVEAIKDFIVTFRQAVDEAGELDQNTRDELEAEIATLEAQANSPKPKRAIIVGTLSSIRSVLENAAGGALGTAALPIVNGILLTTGTKNV